MEQKQVSKKELRRVYKQRRRDMTKDEVRNASDRICTAFRKLPVYRTCKCLFLYISIENEVDTKPIFVQAIADGKRVAAPKVYGDTMKFHSISGAEDLVPGEYGILEPKGGAEVLPEASDLLLMPGIAFDETGGRIGYGGGYYDKYLETHTPGCTVAVAYDWQVIDHIPCDSFDRKPDQILTPTRCLDIRKKYT